MAETCCTYDMWAELWSISLFGEKVTRRKNYCAEKCFAAYGHSTSFDTNIHVQDLYLWKKGEGKVWWIVNADIKVFQLLSHICICVILVSVMYHTFHSVSLISCPLFLSNVASSAQFAREERNNESRQRPRRAPPKREIRTTAFRAKCNHPWVQIPA